MSTSVMQNERLVELLVQRATDGLNASEQVELNRLLAQNQYTDADQFDKTAAALLLASSIEPEPMPGNLHTRLMGQADAFAGQSLSNASRAKPRTATDLNAARNQRKDGRVERRRSGNGIAWVAVAASLVVAIVGWWPRWQGSGAESPVETPRLAREAMLAQPGIIRRDWKSTPDPSSKELTGDVIWDPVKQTGYIRFRGLAVNNPTREQYQLWIFDKTRGDKYPIDGGVFDIPANQDEVVVPILAKLAVGDAAMFAVTVEKPGGVVVSERGRIVALAQVAAG